MSPTAYWAPLTASRPPRHLAFVLHHRSGGALFQDRALDAVVSEDVLNPGAGARQGLGGRGAADRLHGFTGELDLNQPVSAASAGAWTDPPIRSRRTFKTASTAQSTDECIQPRQLRKSGPSNAPEPAPGGACDGQVPNRMPCSVPSFGSAARSHELPHLLAELGRFDERRLFAVVLSDGLAKILEGLLHTIDVLGQVGPPIAAP